MQFANRFSMEQKDQPFASYQEYTEYLFACTNRQLSRYIEGLMRIFASENGGFKNVLYPDIEIAYDLCQKNLLDFTAQETPVGEEFRKESVENLFGDSELESLFAEFTQQMELETESTDNEELTLEQALDYVRHRASLTNLETTPLPLYKRNILFPGRHYPR